MARYIDSDWLYEKVENRYRVSSGIEHRCERDLLDLICEAPTADVVPRERYDRAMDGLKAVLEEKAEDRAELAREIFEEIEREITDALKSNYKVLPQIEESEALWNNVNGKINALRGIGYFIAELKKKYTEEK